MLQTQMQRRRSQSVRQTRPQRVLRFAVLQIIASMQRRFLLDGRQWGNCIAYSNSEKKLFPLIFNKVFAMVAVHSTGSVSDYKAFALYEITSTGFQVATETYQIGLRYVAIGQ